LLLLLLLDAVLELELTMLLMVGLAKLFTIE